ncbi:xanthine dehydrogenase family protein molybdopterin-binding subunit [Pseudooceanicola aestuarii]|uniref:xanthine dehydrogenase family protein molybdopterin-binding subunit n=1 Tax=Pseudooceanicola aestuarii TaxID=2697319 RepID=UPI0013D15B9A|nr:xanthine dehydrogenase family protein molybdopterin-binding subunit [Pseudooceanicola aestuarii]
MEKFGKSQPVRRIEDVRFVTGQGRYIDDATPAGALFAYVHRAPVANARITELDLEDARQAPGVHMVIAAPDLAEAGVTKGLIATPAPNRDGSKGAQPRHPLLADGIVRFAGEGLALIVADSPEAARDAAELIVFDYEDLPAVATPGATGADLHPEAPGNRAVDYATGNEDAMKAAFDDAAHVVHADVVDHRIMVVPMEPRGCFAEWDGTRLHLAMGGQGVWAPKRELARLFDLEEDDIRVTIPDVGGGFGLKTKLFAEYALCAFAAMKLGQPVRWLADRMESMLTDNGARDLTHQVSMAFDVDYRLTGYHVRTKYNLGAYNSNFGQMIQTFLFARVLMGVYDCQGAFLEAEGYYTNTAPTDAYRGAGRPEAIFLLERMMDYAARDLGIDPFELRRKSFIPVDSFPYTTVTGETYDVGDFNRVLDRAIDFADVAGFGGRRATAEATGRLRGLGLCYYIESILGDPSETAKVEFNADGTVNIYVGTQSNGQGHETVYARFLSDQTGIPMEMIRVIQGDSDRIAKGGGTGGSRSVTTQSNATLAVVGTMVESFATFLAEKMEVDPADISFDDESFRIQGSNAAPTLIDVAEMAREAGREDLMIHEQTAKLPARSYPNGAHIAEVEVDPETGRTTLEKYTVVDDFGNLINPLLAEGQVHGGVAQGAGQALMELAHYDTDGQLVTASFMDYAMPRAADMPMFVFTTEAVPSTSNPMGMKGCGEAGTVGAMGATANAVMDALSRRGLSRADMPFTPSRVWAMLQNVPRAAE